MKERLFMVLTLSCLIVLTASLAYSQETKGGKKALDAFINATTKAATEPVPGAQITVEQVRPKTGTRGMVTTGEEMDIVGLGFEKKILCNSNEKGEFSFNLPFEQFENLPNEFHLKFTIRPKDPTKFPVTTNSVILKVNKPASPKLEFVVAYEKPDTKSTGTGNKGTFAVNSKAQN